MKLDQLMRDAVAAVEVDVHDLAAVARARGTVRRHQRRLAVVLAGVGAAATIGGIAALAVPSLGGSGGEPAPTSASDGALPEQPGPLVPLDGQATLGVLAALVHHVGGEGATDAYEAQGAVDGGRQGGGTYAQLNLTPPGEGLGEISVNVQGRDVLELVGTTCAGYSDDCATRTLPGGDVLRLSSDDDGSVVGLRRTAELLSASRGIRVSVSASNGVDLPSSQWDVTRDDTVLDDDQLVAIATDDVWAFRVPGAYAEQGEAMLPDPDGGPDGGAQPSAEPSA